MSDFKYVLIVTYGRSGSTLLQAVINSIPGYYIRGENSNFCWGLYRSYCSLATALAHCDDNGGDVGVTTHPWYGVNEMSVERYLSDARELAASQVMCSDKNKKVTGFKEIRYASDYVLPKLEDYLSFLIKLFPKVAIIFNIRNHDAVKKSGWWGKMSPDVVEKKLSAADAKFEAFNSANPDNTFLVDYDDLVGGNSARHLYEFLGEEFDETAFFSVLNSRHSY